MNLSVQTLWSSSFAEAPFQLVLIAAEPGKAFGVEYQDRVGINNLNPIRGTVFHEFSRWLTTEGKGKSDKMEPCV